MKKYLLVSVILFCLAPALQAQKNLGKALETIGKGTYRGEIAVTNRLRALPPTPSTRVILQKPSSIPTTRVKGADISGYSESGLPWAAEYKLNKRFLNSLSAPASKATPRETIEAMFPFQCDRLIEKYSLSFSEGDELLEKIKLFHHERVNWVSSHPNKGRDMIFEVPNGNAIPTLAKELLKKDVVFIGEVHGHMQLRDAFVDLLTEIKGSSSRQVVIFAEAVYLPPMKGEAIFPYSYYRRGVDGVAPPFDKANPKGNAHILSGDSNFINLVEFSEKFSVPIYPIEDAVITQIQKAKGTISTLQGLGERNVAMSRAIRQQMEVIRQQNPDALFVIFGGMAHMSREVPFSMPKLFSNEKTAVVELVPDAKPHTMSFLEKLWEGHPAFSSKNYTRLYGWKNTQNNAAAWGENTGFDFRVIISNPK